MTFLLVMTGYILLAFVRNKTRLKLLNEACDPEAFLEKVEKQRVNAGEKSKLSVYVTLNQAAGLITLGRYAEAKQLLLSVDKSNLSPKNDTQLVYTINLKSFYRKSCPNGPVWKFYTV